MNTTPANDSRPQSRTAPAVTFGFVRFLLTVFLATPVAYLIVRYSTFRYFFGLPGQTSSPNLLLFIVSLIGGVVIAAVFRSIWIRRARARRAGDSQAGWWPAARPFVFAVGLMATVCVLFFTVENWRGARAWAAVEADLQAKGERLDIASMMRPPIPDAENFAATPLFKAAHALVPRTKPRESLFDAGFVWNSSPEADAARHRLDPLTRLEPKATRTNSSIALMVGRLPNGRIDLAQYAAAMRASTNYQFNGPAGVPAVDLLTGFGQWTAELSEMEAASRRPHGRFDTHPEDLYGALLPALSPMKGLSRTFMIRSVARLTTGDRNGAFSDLLTSSRLGETQRDEWYTVSQLVRLACHAQSLRGLAEGIAEHAWTDAQLEEYQAFQSNISFRDGLLRALHSEQVIGQLTMDQLKHHRAEVLLFERLMGNDDTSIDTDAIPLFCFSPDGWFDQNRARLVSHYQSIIGLVRQSAREALPVEPVNALFIEMKLAGQQHLGIYSYFVNRLMPGMKGILDRINEAEARQRLAITACALERYWVKNHTYPAALSELVPAFLPTMPVDLMNPASPPAPLAYRRTDDNWYLLYSVGENRKDDQGVSRRAPTDTTDLDWVWPVPVGEGKRLF